MSWQDYVNAYLIYNTDVNRGKTASNVCEGAAIIGNTDGTVWASSTGFNIGKYTIEIEKDDGSSEKAEIDEFQNLLDAFNNNGVATRKGGIRLNNEKYFIVSYDEERNVLYLKKSGGGAAIAKSNLAFVIGTFSNKLKAIGYNGAEEPQNPGLTNGAVESLQKFLLENSL